MEIKFNGTIIGEKGRPLKGRRHTRGYLRVSSKGKDYYIHRLVAQEYLPNPNNHPQVNHKDEDKTNNHVSNLEWCTNEYNNQYSAKLDKSQAQAIRDAVKGGYSYKNIAAYFNVNVSCISKIKLGTRWQTT